MMMPPWSEPFVTILFTDFAGSPSLFERPGDEQPTRCAASTSPRCASAVAEHGGREVKSTGDGLMVAFSSAVAAVRCAVDMQRATRPAPDGLGLRIGLDAGEPLPDGDDLYGTPVIVASRLCDAAGAGEILASDVVRQIAGPRVAEPMQPAGALRVARHRGRRVAVAQVLWRDEATRGAARRAAGSGPRDHAW